VHVLITVPWKWVLVSLAYLCHSFKSLVFCLYYFILFALPFLLRYGHFSTTNFNRSSEPLLPTEPIKTALLPRTSYYSSAVVVNRGSRFNSCKEQSPGFFRVFPCRRRAKYICTVLRSRNHGHCFVKHSRNEWRLALQVRPKSKTRKTDAIQLCSGKQNKNLKEKSIRKIAIFFFKRHLNVLNRAKVYS